MNDEKTQAPPELLDDERFSYYRLKFALVSKSACFIVKRDFLLEKLKDAGFEAEIFDSFEAFAAFDPDCVVVFQPMDFPVPKDKSKIWVAFQAEQLYTRETGGEIFSKTHLKALKPYLKVYDIILDFSEENANLLRRYTKARVELFCDYARKRVCLSEELTNAPEYDILFIGNMPGVDGRRQAIIDHLSKKYKVHPMAFDLWREKKVRAIKNSKICLNIHYEEARFEEQERFLDYIENHAFVLSEPMYNPIFEDGKEYVSFYLSDLDKKIDYYLSHEDERQRIADRAYEHYEKLASEESEKSFHRFLDCVILESYRRELIRRDRARPIWERIDPRTR